MSVRPEAEIPSSPILAGTDGELVSATISVEPELLEQLLDALSEVRFPINPQIYHNGSVARIYPDGREELLPATIVEFPAYRGRLHEVRELLERRGFPPDALWAKSLLDDIHSDSWAQPGPPGSAYALLVRRKHPLRAV